MAPSGLDKLDHTALGTPGAPSAALYVCGRLVHANRPDSANLLAGKEDAVLPRMHSRTAYPRPQVPKTDMIHAMLAAAGEVERD